MGEARARARSHSGPEDPENDNFEAVVVMTDPHDWFEALQVRRRNTEGVMRALVFMLAFSCLLLRRRQR